ncbi:MAG TPA: YpdA family putative bacillithiol disulfide reductase [Candidatus Acidoferrales bacterium]|nr:YpdA family putative bacillithiol disulfide reductase [Candidatus Acidoferrales bacterium]
MTYDLICVGAGPTGLACAIEAKRAGMKPLVVDKGCLCNSLLHYPINMLFFTTAERMEIGDLPMAIAGDKPTRTEALKYYRKMAEHYGLEVRQFETVEEIHRADGAFRVRTRHPSGAPDEHRSTRVVIATGYYDIPKRLRVPGEELPHVSHYYTEPHSYWRRNVVVVGAGNSAAEAALDLFRAGAHVTLVHRGAQVSRRIKYWLLPDIENRIAAGEIEAHFDSVVSRIEPGHVLIRPRLPDEVEQRSPWQTDDAPGEAVKAGQAIPADAVFALTGYRPDFAFLMRQGIELDPATQKPKVNEQTLETNVPGLYVAGVIVGGEHTSEIFIENGRFHGKQIVSSFG